MKGITLNDLPDPPSDKLGWPWTEEHQSASISREDGSNQPIISIVTPSYNQGQFLEETIRSVLLQGYPNLEYIIIDGGSTDNSVDIIKKYEPWLTYWESESDQGQSHALNKGFIHAKGEILGWINSDDLYFRNSLNKVAQAFYDTACDVLSGNTIYLESGRLGKKKPPSILTVNEMLVKYLSPAPQPSSFWSHECWKRYGPLDEDLHYRMDYAFFLCLSASKFKWHFCDEDFAIFRRHEQQKTWAWSDPQFHHEKKMAIKRFAEFDNFAQVFAKDIEHALHYEGWLISWMAVNHVHDGGMVNSLRMLTVPFYNWRCLFLPLFYRKSIGCISSSIRAMFQIISHSAAKIEGNN